MSFKSIDMSALPAPAVVETLDFEAIVQALKDDLLSRLPEAADTLTLESEPLVKLLEVAAYREVLLRARVNDGAKAVMVAFARASDLDHLAALVPLARFDGESDADFRARVQLAPAGFSVAGPKNSYVFHALSATPDIKDATAVSPAPGMVTVTVLGRTGDGSVSQVTLDAVAAAVTDDDVRPLTDQVTVESASIIPYEVDARLTVLTGPDTTAVIAAATVAVQDYAAAQHRLGRPIMRSALFAALHQPGVESVELISPAADIPVAENEAAFMTGGTVSAGGL